MIRPIPLAAPDGTVYAYACGRCHRVAGGTHVPGPVSPVARLAGYSLERATRCCVCPCGAPSGDGLWRKCADCDARDIAAWKARHASTADARSARGMRECDACAGWGGPVLSDADCDTCGGKGEVPL